MTQQWQPITAHNITRLTEIAHTGCGFITDAAWSPDGAVLAVAHGSGVWLWRDGFANQPSLIIPQDDASIKSVAFDPTGKVLVTASANTTVALWMVESGRRLTVLRGHQGSVEAVALGGGGSLVASGGTDQKIRLLNLKETMQRFTFEGHTDEVTDLVFISSSHLASASRDGTIRLWDIQTKRPERVLEGHTDWVRALAINPAGDTLASVSRDATVRLWDIASGAQKAALPHGGDSRAVAFNLDGGVLAADDLGTIRLWDVERQTLLRAVEAHHKPVLTLAFHPVGTMLVSGGGDNVVRLWGVTA